MPGGFIDLPVIGDSMLRGGDKNTNEGANPLLSIAGSGNTRIVLNFGVKPLNSFTAELLLTVADNPGNWGAGKFISVHELQEPFVEGDGQAWELSPSQQVRGSGSGVTWNCPIDANIHNQAANCADGWAGGEFGAGIDSVLITNDTTGVVTLDVTAWYNTVPIGFPLRLLVKKDNDGAPGRVDFYSAEGAPQPWQAPRLRINTSTPCFSVC